jgi:hypothetical protein
VDLVCKSAERKKRRVISASAFVNLVRPTDPTLETLAICLWLI